MVPTTKLLLRLVHTLTNSIQDFLQLLFILDTSLISVSVHNMYHPWYFPFLNPFRIELTINDKSPRANHLTKIPLLLLLVHRLRAPQSIFVRFESNPMNHASPDTQNKENAR